MPILFCLIFILFFQFYVFRWELKKHFERKKSESKTKLGQIYYKNLFTVIVVFVWIFFIIFIVSVIGYIGRDKCEDKDYFRSHSICYNNSRLPDSDSNFLERSIAYNQEQKLNKNKQK
jgi:hypothetical protein